MKKRKQIYAPFGYKLPKEVFVDDEATVRDLCSHLTDDPNFIRMSYTQPLKELLKMLKENGFTIE